MMNNPSHEYTPILGSPAHPSSKKPYIFGGVSVLLCLSLLVVTTSGGVVQHNVTPQPQMAVQKPLVKAAPAPVQPAPTELATVATEAVQFTPGQYDIVYNILSFAIACMGSATVFFFFQFSLVDKKYRTALVITALVTLIAFYHYIRIFNSFTDAYSAKDGVVTATGIPFNDAYRYVDWILTVPLLLMELILVMDLSPAETRSNCIRLGVSAAIMIVLGYPGEISESTTIRWVFWALAMIPFLYIVYTLFVGLKESVAEQPERARSLVSSARWVTVLSWCTYPIVYILPMMGCHGASARTGIQIGYSIADVIAKPLLGLVVWQIAKRKSASSDSNFQPMN